ncbi:uncharacterized protein AMSG_05065 [Thecamonas trahens ATCC 50062]|uniref:Uncharacterized protein n=1 Tax=Thecamonas trahens ATCC 50062 TaxID=461836 RepID=A0A0L0D9S3_THETB|nr:hypothetical protein AMSG_05065 [Thecamonas trahens ATCC 50062]KNC49097.1 hypothetical protein AMSG_05065 [Thecamonas trahens ATCC 50062]|eukprot:XP_013758126.1 hypothetical protein AMSG_05065 [Thecamonas trahens ATCC 50062]
MAGSAASMAEPAAAMAEPAEASVPPVDPQESEMPHKPPTESMLANPDAEKTLVEPARPPTFVDEPKEAAVSGESSASYSGDDDDDAPSAEPAASEPDLKATVEAQAREIEELKALLAAASVHAAHSDSGDDADTNADAEAEADTLTPASHKTKSRKAKSRKSRKSRKSKSRKSKSRKSKSRKSRKSHKSHKSAKPKAKAKGDASSSSDDEEAKAEERAKIAGQCRALLYKVRGYKPDKLSGDPKRLAARLRAAAHDLNALLRDCVISTKKLRRIRTALRETLDYLEAASGWLGSWWGPPTIKYKVICGMWDKAFLDLAAATVKARKRFEQLRAANA